MKIRERIILILLICFFTHGFIYLFFPAQIYESFWAKYIKYVVFVLYFVVTAGFINWVRFLSVTGIVISFIFLADLSHTEISFSAIIARLNFFLPFFLLANRYKISSGIIKKGVVIIACTAIFFSIIEYFFLKDFMIFNNHLDRGGYYRVISVFINPNGAALMFSLFIICILKYFEPLKISPVILLILCGLTLIFTGSKSPLMLFVLYYWFKCTLPVLIRLKIKRKLFFKLFFIVCFSGLLYFVLTSDELMKALSLRSYDLTTADMRMGSYNEFWSMINRNFFAPEFNISLGSSDLTSDSAFLGLWGDFGFVGVILYLGIVGYVLFKERNVSIDKFSFVAAFLLTGFGIKIFYIWPLSYIFFYILSQSSAKNSNSQYS